MAGLATILCTAPLAAPAHAQAPAAANGWAQVGTQGDYRIANFAFRSGETLPELTLHYTTLGTPQRDARGTVRNAVLILHGTGGSGRGSIRVLTRAPGSSLACRMRG